MWMTQNESARVLATGFDRVTESRTQGYFYCLCWWTDRFSVKAIEAVFPKTQVQLCIVHMVRNSLSYVSYKDRKAVAADLRLIYTATTQAEAEQQLVNFAEQWDKQYPTISKSWLTHWQRIIPFFAFPPEIRKAIYTTNAIESMNMTRSKSDKDSSSFSNRWVCSQGDLPGNSEHCSKMDNANSGLEACFKSLCYWVWRSLSFLTFTFDTIYLTYPIINLTPQVFLGSLM